MNFKLSFRWIVFYIFIHSATNYPLNIVCVLGIFATINKNRQKLLSYGVYILVQGSKANDSHSQSQLLGFS